MYICITIANLHTMIKRHLQAKIEAMLQKFPVISVTGPRQSGKTTLLRHAFDDYQYINLERPDYRQLFEEDPVGFLKGQGEKVIIDEAQHLPDLFSYVQVISDERGTPGQYILSGSQSFLMNDKISQSLAGRVHIQHLFPFDISELPAEEFKEIPSTIWRGFYPRIFDQKISSNDFYPAYLQTYVERDVRSLRQIENLQTFHRFLGLCAGRIGQLINYSSLANDTGVSVNTVKSWLSLLEASFIIYPMRPYYRNFSKRLVKAPKLYFYDTGLACSLLRITQPEMVWNHYLYGSLFENLVVSEIIKYHFHQGLRPNIYFWRDNNGVEIDCLVEKSSQELALVEIKGGQTFTKDFLKNLKRFPAKDKHLQLSKFLIYGGEEALTVGDINISPWQNLPTLLKNLIS